MCVPTEENGEVVNYYHCHYCEYKSRTHWYVKTHMQTVHKDIDLNPKEHPKRKRKRHSVVGHNAPEGRRGGRANSDGSDSDYDPLGDSSRRRRRGSDHPSFDEQPGLAALFMCGRCDYTSESCYHYKRHITSRKVHPEEVAEDPSENNGKYKCGKCSFSSITCRDILQHLLDEHSPTSQEANSEAVDEESGGANATSSKYEPKIGQPFECGRCEYTTRITNHFKRHIKNRNVHPEGESEDMSEHRNEYICGKCTFSSRKCSSILEHLSEDHKPPALSQTKTAIRRRTNKIYKCDRCPYRIGQYSHLQQHVERIHLKVRNFRCEKCGKAFAVKQSLEWHKCHLSTKKRLKNVINGVQIKKEVMSGDELEEEPKKKKKKRTPFQVKRMPVGEKAIQEVRE